MDHELPVGNLADETPVLVLYPRTSEEERGDRARWPWLPGTILQQVGPDEFQILVEDLAVAVRKDGSRPTPARRRTGCAYPLCFRDASEIKLVSARDRPPGGASLAAGPRSPHPQRSPCGPGGRARHAVRVRLRPPAAGHLAVTRTAVTFRSACEAYWRYRCGTVAASSLVRCGRPGEAPPKLVARRSSPRVLGQVACHVLPAQASASGAPWRLALRGVHPVAELAIGMIRAAAPCADDRQACPWPSATADDTARTVAQVVPGPVADHVPSAVPEAVPDTSAAPDAPRTVARRGRRRPVSHTRRAERKYAPDLADGQVPSLRAVMADLHIGQDRARQVRAHLASLAASNGQVSNG